MVNLSDVDTFSQLSLARVLHSQIFLMAGWLSLSTPPSADMLSKACVRAILLLPMKLWDLLVEFLLCPAEEQAPPACTAFVNRGELFPQCCGPQGQKQTHLASPLCLTPLKLHQRWGQLGSTCVGELSNPESS